MVIDRTNWKDGESDINYFVLSALWNDISIPIYWLMLDNKGGSSNDSQIIQLIQLAIDVFGADAITNIYADREFPSLKFLSYLIHDNSCCKSYLTLEDNDSAKIS